MPGLIRIIAARPAARQRQPAPRRFGQCKVENVVINPTTLLGGVLLGLASSLHCAGMCGGIGSSLTLAAGRSARTQAQTLVIAQAGKAVAYAAAGGVLGALGSGVYGLFDRQNAHLVLQWLGAAGLVWIGLSLLGLVPAFAAFEGVSAPIRRWAWSNRRSGYWASGLAGLAWGLLPCGMVYSALLFAMLAGSAVSGAAVMLGFGLGVMPSVTAAALGVSRLPQLARGRLTRLSIGGALIVIGMATLVWPMGGPQTHCAPGRAPASGSAAIEQGADFGQSLGRWLLVGNDARKAALSVHQIDH